MTHAPVPLEAVSAEMALRASEATDLGALCLSLVVDDGPSLILATDIVSDLRDRRTALDARRQEITRPLLAAKKSVDDLFREPLKALEGVEEGLRAKIGAYTLAKAQERVKAVQEAGSDRGALVPPPAMAPGLSARFRWIAEVTDPDAVPRELCSPDPAKIARAIAYADTPHTPPRPIAGLEFVADVRTTVRSR